ncbi:MAG: RNA-binding cell elongation regulator Jag/EloR [Cellulosilyticaceae bacterium]
MRFLEKTGRNLDSAITDALIELGATRDEVTIEVLEKGSKGFLGLGAKNARVRVTVKEESDEIEEVVAPEEEVVIPQPEPKAEVKEVVPAPQKEAKRPVDVEAGTQKAIEFLTKVLKEMNVDAAFTSKSEGDKVYIDISGEKMGIVIGKRGETLDSLQYLTNIVVNKSNENYIKIMLDTENYRERREETLQKVALKYAKKASQLRRPVTLEPMNPYDRRIIHSVLQNSKSVKTHSEGREPFRKVVITPISSNKNYRK